YPTHPAILTIDATIGAGGTFAGGPNASLPPHFGHAAVAAGFALGAFVLDVKAGGPMEIEGIGAECPRYLTQAPSFRLDFTGGSTPLTFSAIANGTAAPILLHDPAGGFSCSATA